MKMSGDSKEKVHRYEKIEFLGEGQVLLRIIELVIEIIVSRVTGFIKVIPTATGVNIFDAAIKVSLSILVNITQFNLWVV